MVASLEITKVAENGLIDGKLVSQLVQEELKEKVAKAIQNPKAKGRKPQLVVILVGERKDSKTYVGAKVKACGVCGIESQVVKLDEAITQEALEEEIRKLCADDSVDGLLVQLPLPKHINETQALSLIPWEKDVDGLHPHNMGLVAMKSHEPVFIPCTAHGVLELLKRYEVPMAGKKAVVIGRSEIAGLPIALLLLRENATVTMCHSRTADLAKECREGDIVVAAVGKANFVKADWLKDGAVVVDVGINAVDDATKASGYRLVGDVDFAECKSKAKLITPVPGGVGPMTVAMLMCSTLRAFEYHISKA